MEFPPLLLSRRSRLKLFCSLLLAALRALVNAFTCVTYPACVCFFSAPALKPAIRVLPVFPPRQPDVLAIHQ